MRMFSRVKLCFPFAKAKNSNLLIIFKPIYFLLTLLRIFPYSLKFNTRGCKIIHKSIYINCVCAALFVLVTLVFFSLHLQIVILHTNSSTFTDAITTQINYILELFNLTLFTVIAYICAYYNRLTYIDILNKLASSWNELPKNDSVSIEQLGCSVKKYLIFLSIVLFLNLCVYFTRIDYFWMMILVAFTFNVTQLIQYMVLIYFSVLILMIVAVLSVINENCTNILKRKNLTEYFITVDPRMPIVTLRHLELIYVKVMDTKRDINNAFQMPLLLSMLQCFHSMIAEAYTIYHGTISEQLLTAHEVINCSIWFTYQAIKVYILAYTGSVLKREVMKLGQTLHNIPIEKQDQRLMIEIQHFSSLISFQGPELTVFGFFSIDATLIFNITAAATMYLIILVQFERSGT